MDSHNDDVSEVNNITPTALNSTVVLGHKGNEKRCTIPQLQN